MVKKAKKNFKPAKTQEEIREGITTRIVDALKKGVAPWRKPWTLDPNCGTPINFVSKKRYRGVNPILLDISASEQSLASRFWATYKQWGEHGGQVKRGEKGTVIVFYRIIEKDEVKNGKVVMKDGNPKRAKIFVLRNFVVFNLDQVSGEKLDKYRPMTPELLEEKSGESPDWKPADDVIEATGAVFKPSKGNKAFYVRPFGAEFPKHTGGDFIQMPGRKQFMNLKDWYATRLHEMIHWSECRLSWSGSYAMGELVAEVGSAFLCTELRLPQSDNLDNHSAYLASWLKEMQNDPKWIFRAATQAEKAAEYILGFSRGVEDDLQEENKPSLRGTHSSGVSTTKLP